MAAGTTTADIAAQHAVGLSILPTKIGAESGIRQLTLDTDTSTDNNTRVGRQESVRGHDTACQQQSVMIDSSVDGSSRCLRRSRRDHPVLVTSLGAE
jgi:hypothetical protein